MTELLTNHIELLAIPIIVGGVGFIVNGLLIMKRQPTPVVSPETTEVLNSIKEETTQVITSNNAALDGLRTRLPNSKINEAIDVIQAENLTHITNIANKVDVITETLTISNSMLDFGVSCIFMGLAFTATVYIVKAFTI